MTHFLSAIAGWLNSNLGVITLVVGLVAVYLYLKQKRDNKRSAASLVLQEIRYAEQKIREHRRQASYKIYDQLLPTNNWYNNINLFIRDLEESQIDMISRFYSQCLLVDIMIRKIADKKASEIMVPAVLPAPTPATASPTGPAPSIQIVVPGSLTTLDQISSEIEFIYETPAIDKLRKIANPRWYKRIL